MTNRFFRMKFPRDRSRNILAIPLCVLASWLLAGCENAPRDDGAEPRSFGQFEGFVMVTPGEPLEAGRVYLCLSYGLNRNRFEFYIDEQLVLAGTASDDVEQFAQLQGPTVVKGLPDLPEQFEVRVTVDGKPTFQDTFKRAGGSFLILRYERQQEKAEVHQAEGLVYE